MIAITFALPDESRDLVHALQHPGTAGSAEGPVILGNLGDQEVLVVHTGMGGARTRERLTRFFKEHRVDCLISAGYAGGLDPSLPTGAIVLAGNYSDPLLLKTASEFFGDRARTGCLATSSLVLETCEAKARFARETGAVAVDMETETIAALCREHGVPLLSIRAISDPANEELAVPFSVCFDAETERPRPGALIRFLIRHPSRIRGFVGFVTAIGRVRRGLAEALAELVGAWKPVRPEQAAGNSGQRFA